MAKDDSSTSKKLIYLASPYSHPDQSVREQRFRDVCHVAGRLMQAGHHVYSPIAHTHPIAVIGELPLSWDFWQEYDRAIIECCKAVWVVKLDGWETSHGVGSELDIAAELGLEIRFLTREGEFDE